MKRSLFFAIIAICTFSISSTKGQDGLYGLTSSGGKFNVGTVLYSDSTGSVNVEHDLFRFDGSNPHGELLEASDGLYYGTTPSGGANSLGLIFSYNVNTGAYKKVFDMVSATGSAPYCTLIEPTPGTLYGTTSTGGANGFGVLFEFVPSTGTYTVLHDFDGTNGQEPWSGVIHDSGNLYGLTRYGGADNRGTLYEYDILGTTYTKLVDFNTARGTFPLGDLYSFDGNLYGVALGGGTFGGGTLFRYGLLSTTFDLLHEFDTPDGKTPFRGVIQAADGLFYGLTSSGGSMNGGTLYSFDADLLIFTVEQNLGIVDGRNPLGILHEANNGLLYGMTQLGGAGGGGTLFSFNTTTSTYTVLEDFSGNSGIKPWAGVMQGSNDNLYGLTFQGGENNSGTLGEFDINTSTWTALVNFNTSDGANPNASLTLHSNGKMYGMAPIGGSFNLGVIFEYDQLTETYTLKHSFDQIEGSFPYGGLVEGADGKLYGMTSNGGTDGVGVIFSFNPTNDNFSKRSDLTVVNGSEPLGSMILANDGLMYGMTNKGGAGGNGAIFSFDPNTNAYVKLINLTGAGGKRPEGDLVQASNGELFGLARYGGSDDVGSIFKYDIVGGTFTKLLDFSLPLGGEPIGSLEEANNGLLYGTTSEGGGNLLGVVFTWDISGSTYNIIHDFNGTNGEAPHGSLAEGPDGTLYGTTLRGGTSNDGVLFKIWPGSNQYTKLTNLNSSVGIFPFGDLVYYEEPGLKMNISVFLEGPYNSLTGQMEDDLRSAGYVPTTEPFTGLGFTHAGNGGGETIDPSVLNVTGNDAIVDWLFIELRDKNNSTAVVSTRSALIQRDGDVVDLDGVSELVFEEGADDYFVAVRHRNHLGIMTLNPVTLSATNAVIDFASGATATFGTAALKDISGTNVMWTGNVNFDDLIKYTGAANDRDPILVAIGGAVPTATISGYHSEDCTMDGVVKYTGANNDRDPILVNIGGVVPTNTKQEQLP